MVSTIFFFRFPLLRGYNLVFLKLAYTSPSVASTKKCFEQKLRIEELCTFSVIIKIPIFNIPSPSYCKNSLFLLPYFSKIYSVRQQRYYSRKLFHFIFQHDLPRPLNQKSPNAPERQFQMRIFLILGCGIFIKYGCGGSSIITF